MSTDPLSGVPEEEPWSQPSTIAALPPLVERRAAQPLWPVDGEGLAGGERIAGAMSVFAGELAQLRATPERAGNETPPVASPVLAVPGSAQRPRRVGLVGASRRLCVVGVLIALLGATLFELRPWSSGADARVAEADLAASSPAAPAVEPASTARVRARAHRGLAKRRVGGPRRSRQGGTRDARGARRGTPRPASRAARAMRVSSTPGTASAPATSGGAASELRATRPSGARVAGATTAAPRAAGAQMSQPEVAPTSEFLP